MSSHATIATLLLCPLLVACDPLFGSRLEGRWDIELTDFDDCGGELDLEQDGRDVFGDADVFCRVYFEVDGELYYYDFEESRADVEGRRDGSDFDLTITFWDDFFEYEVEVVLEGTVDGDRMDGDAEIDGDDAGEFEGDR
jgi:hypothetical protein